MDTKNIDDEDKARRIILPAFDPENYEIRNRTYSNSGVHSMVGTIEFYLPGLDMTVWANCNEEYVSIYDIDYIWGEDECPDQDDHIIIAASFDEDLPESFQQWLPMIHETLAYTVEQQLSQP